MKHASAMIGNSSAGVREAPFLGLPSLDVGTRQNNRALSESVEVCNPLDNEGIRNFLTNRWNKWSMTDESYGDGKSMRHFVRILGDLDFWSKSSQKVFFQND
jgi:UDP-N-acetylglucosamine 2-epimerase (hydrolysing)